MSDANTTLRFRSNATLKRFRAKTSLGNLIADAQELIGVEVFKRSGKPFKSKEKINTVSGITTNPNTVMLAFTFEEDESIVDIWKCSVYNSK